MDIIDPHLHLFDLEQGNYDWLKSENPPAWPDKDQVRKNYSESDLSLPDKMTLTGFVHIEAGFDNEQPWRELKWLSEHCTLPYRTVAYADLTSEEFSQQLQHLLAYESLVGIRYILEEQALELFDNPTFVANLQLLQQQGLIFESQFPLDDHKAVTKFTGILEQTPDLKVVINHAGLPSSLSQEWMDAITALAHHPYCYVKCSGWEMQERKWKVESVKPYINFITRQFGLTRVMLASNFPVSELSCSYSDLWRRYSMEMKFKGFEKELLLHDTAQQLYGL